MNRISELRKEKHLSQIALALELNISQYMVSAFETERHQLTTDMLISLSDFFNVSIDYLLGRSAIRHHSDLTTTLSNLSIDAKQKQLWERLNATNLKDRETAINILSVYLDSLQ